VTGPVFGKQKGISDFLLTIGNPLNFWRAV
jgi:hypothetical protein